MPKAAGYLLIWQAERRSYELREHPSQHLLTVTHGERAWFAWLDTVPSFTFEGQQGQLTARKESRQRGDQYWYAYHRVGQRLTKKYLGRTTDLTVTRLEEVAALLTGAEVSPPDVAAVLTPSDEMAQSTGRSRGVVKVDIPAVAADVITVPSARPSVQRDPLLMTKLHVPRPRAQLVLRSHLIKRLQQGMECALTLVSAPAGFGKTTLLAQWLAESNTPVAWLSLEPQDNDPIRFLTYLIVALQRVDAHLGTTVLELLHSPQPPLETVLALLTNDLLQHTTSYVALVLDDYHVITTDAIHHAMTFLLDHLPPHLHLFLATRADPPLPLGRLRARGQLTEVRATELRFAKDEINTFLHIVMGLDSLSEEEVVSLQIRTEGWITGLQLAALSLQGRSDVPAFLSAFTGSHRFVLDYLSEEVLARQPESVQAFLLHTSILERLSGPLCDAVTEQDQGQMTLEMLDKANLFVICLDDERRWYRYHHLFAEVLLHRLQQLQPTFVPQLHQRASAWYTQQGFFFESVQHALAAHDFEQVAFLIERARPNTSMATRRHVHTVLGWLNALPDTLVRRHPVLCLLYTETLLHTGQLEMAKARLRDTEDCTMTVASSAQTQTVQGWIATIRSNIALYSGDVAHSVALSQQALALLPEIEVDLRATAAVNAARLYLVNGDVTDTTQRLIERLFVTVRSSSNRSEILQSNMLLAHLFILQGKLRQAASIMEQAMQAVPTRIGISRLLGGASYHLTLGDLLYEWNELDAAEQHLLDGLDRVRGTVTFFAPAITGGYYSLARLQQARGKYHEAMVILEEFAVLAHQRYFAPHLVVAGAAAGARLQLMRGDLASATRWVEESNLSTGDMDLSYLNERAYLTLARVRIAQGRAELADHGNSGKSPFLQESLDLLARLLLNAEAKGRIYSMIEILVVQALALDAQGDQKRALGLLERTLQLAGTEGYIRIFLDEGTPVLDLLQQARRRGLFPTYTARLLAAFGEPIAPAPPAPASHASVLPEPLTAREREVLRLLLEGASNREIARRLVLSINTVKRHVYNLCGKMGVQSRTQAIVKARMLDLR